MDNLNVSFIILAIVVMWFIQLGLSSWQMKRYYARLRELRRYGTVATGMAGSVWRGRVYGLLAVDEQERVVRAEVLQGWTIFAAPRPVPQLEGSTVQQILDGNVRGLTSKQIEAFQQAANFLRQREEKARSASV